MNLVADENVDAGSVSALRDAGHRLIYVRELDPGIDDTRVLALANELDSLLLTSDKDFGEHDWAALGPSAATSASSRQCGRAGCELA